MCRSPRFPWLSYGADGSAPTITRPPHSKVNQWRKYYNDVPTIVVADVNVAVMIGWSPTGRSVLPHAAELPAYTRTQALTGTAILLALCLIVVAVIALLWWQRR
jgi:hypothetical protein